MSELHPIVSARFSDHVDTLSATYEVMGVIEAMAERCKAALASGNKILFCGNGGSAADSQHLAAELVGRFQKERRSLASIALTTDTSILTAVGNDYGYDEVFARQVDGLGRSGDILIGEGGGKMAELCDLTFAVPSKVTARIQEMHILAGHILCELVEEDYA